MIERQATWGEIAPGMYVRDRNQKAWRVQDQRGGRLLLVRPHDESTTVTRPPADTVVTVLDPTDDEAVALLKRELGADVIAVKEPGRPIQCPPLAHRLDLVHTHMFMLHGLWTKSGPGSKSVAKLLEAHRDDHLDPDGPTSHAFVRHEHH